MTVLGKDEPICTCVVRGVGGGQVSVISCNSEKNCQLHTREQGRVKSPWPLGFDKQIYKRVSERMYSCITLITWHFKTIFNRGLGKVSGW